MADENKPSSGNTTSANKGRKRKYLPHGKPAKKGSYPLRPGVQGFFITCDGGREQQAAREALNLLDTFYKDLVHPNDSNEDARTAPSKPVNKVIKFKDSDSSSDDDGDDDDEPPCETKDSDNATAAAASKAHEENEESQVKKQRLEEVVCSGDKEDPNKAEERVENEELQVKKQPCNGDKEDPSKVDEKSFFDLVDDELSELRDKGKRLFLRLDSGCNGVIFIGMRKVDGLPGPSSIAQHMMGSIAATKKHMSRFILRLLPAELACYASEEEISKAIKPLIEKYFPSSAEAPQKFAVLYEARSNTGIERMSIINAVAKSVPEPHKVDLKNPDKTIIVQIVKTICLVGVVERYREFSKYNLRQLTSPPS